MRLEAMSDQEFSLQEEDGVVTAVLGETSPCGTGGRGVSKRRANKHLIERRRRARINSSLTQLKALVLEGMKKDPARYNRLEKADILEMTVTHLRAVRNQQKTDGDSSLPSRYRAGFNECAVEIARFLNGLPGMEDNVKTNILSHMTDCVSRMGQTLGVSADNNANSPTAMLEDCATYGETMADLSQPLDLSRTGSRRSQVDESEFYPALQKYNSDDVESTSSSQDCDLSVNNCPSPRDRQITHDGFDVLASSRRGCLENLDSGVDDEVSSNEDPVCHEDHKTQEVLREGEEGVIRLQDGSMWRPW